MNIVNFTPVSALLGGLLIGFSVALFFILSGRMIGISGIASSVLVTKDKRVDNFLFLFVLILGPIIYNLISGKEILQIQHRNYADFSHTLFLDCPTQL